MELLERVQARARARLERDLSRLRAELSEHGALGDVVREHPLLSVLGATAAGLGLGLGARAALRGSARIPRALSALTLPLALSRLGSTHVAHGLWSRAR